MKIPTRRDALPEFMKYRDDGCDVSPGCLSCPLPRCRFDERGGLRAILNEGRNARIREKHGTMPLSLLALQEGVSKRTIFRVLSA